MKRLFRLVATTWFALCAVGFCATVEAGEMGLMAIEGRLGYVSISENDAGGTFMLAASADLGKMTHDLGLDVGFDFWKKSWGPSGCETDFTNIALGGNVKYAFETRSNFQPYALGGLSLNFQKASLNCGEVFGTLGDTSNSETEIGIHLGAGAEFGSRRGRGMTPVARVGFNTNGGADYFYISGGLKFPMGR